MWLKIDKIKKLCNKKNYHETLAEGKVLIENDSKFSKDMCCDMKGNKLINENKEIKYKFK